jgi:hypothetical protein|tara:strand:+ start:1005 stop:1376 length:372 start_codon:yes stop_codon:yes gene_type:complete
MSHFAKIESGIVTAVIVVEQDIVDTYDGTWVQTSYNTRGNIHYGQDGEPDGGVALRGNYAGIGYIYDADNDVFYIPKPSNSWTLDTDTWSWKSPITYPDDGKLYVWDEDVYQDNNNNGWVLVE